MAGIRRLAALLLATLPVLLAAPMPAAAQAVNSDQLLSIYNNLPPDQQQQLLQQLGVTAVPAATAKLPGQNATTVESTQPDAQRQRQSGETEVTEIPGRPAAFKPNDTLIVEIGFPKTPTTTTSATTTDIPPDEKKRLQDLIEAVRGGNPYRLDRNGVLLLPGFAGIPLAGLTEALATQRLTVEPGLLELELKVTRLPLAKTETENLKPYGYDLFNNAPSTFAPLSDVPVPADYLVGPGDSLDVQLYGSQNRSLKLIVSRDGHVSFPELGPINVGGRRFEDVKSEVEARVAQQMIGVRASLSMGAVRSIRVFVLGEASYPGSYAVSGLATITTALFASGGVKPIGSLRNIQLKRDGKTVRQFDLYDLLMRGDSSNDINLKPGDVVFIPAVGPTASAQGEVRRPAIYELKGNTDVAELVEMAGGFTTDADSSKASLARIDEQHRRIVDDVDLAAGAARPLPIRNGDALTVLRLRPTLDSGVVVQGQVFRPGMFAWRDGLRLTDVIGSITELKPDADQHYLLVRRESGADRHISVVSADLAAAVRDPGSAANIALWPRDQITVFDDVSSRDRIIEPLMRELVAQATLSAPTPVVNVSGRVKVAGAYPLEPGMKIADLIRAGGSLDAAAFAGGAELSRYVVENGKTRRTQVIDVDLAAVLRGEPAANLPLEPYDGLYIKEISGWEKQEQATLEGEVRFPGTYPIKTGETLRSLIERAGGLTDYAFPQGALFTREELREREQVQIDELTARLQNDLVAVALLATRASQFTGQQSSSYATEQSLVTQLKSAKAVGRLVVNLPAALDAKPGSPEDVVLRNGDRLIIPKLRQEIMVLGEVQNVTSHLYQTGLTRDDYINLSGGVTRLADKSRTYIVRADGTIVTGQSRWHAAKSTQVMHPGDAIVVPFNIDRVPELPLWQSVTTILYNIAIAVAAVHTL
jgi:polysaccharide biosynthesis/export protein